jgi:hypothetical protein
MERPTLAVIAAATVAATVAFPASAQANPDFQMFGSPSGNIRCILNAQDGPAPIALCQIKIKTFTVPPGSGRGQTGEPCPYGTGSGNDFRLDQGQPGFIRCSFAALGGGGGGPWPTLEYGQSRSLGAITCESQPSGMTCTDIDSGHFFRVSRDSYELG